jgi:hypothetical protein
MLMEVEVSHRICCQFGVDIARHEHDPAIDTQRSASTPPVYASDAPPPLIRTAGRAAGPVAPR